MYEYIIDVTPYGLNITHNKKLKMLNKTKIKYTELKFEDIQKVIREEYIGRFNSLIFIKKDTSHKTYLITEVKNLEEIYKQLVKYRNIYNFTIKIRDIKYPKYEFDIPEDKVKK